ncbi:MAG: prepilin-type N-terminal cleavage/methylation domain-containing protein [Planctomycetota bacterium]
MPKRAGFTLVELVVVVLIIALLAAVAAPKFLKTTAKANDSGVKHSLHVIRDAIELYVAENQGTLPTAPETDLLPYLRDTAFPPVTVGDAADTVGANQVSIVATSGVLTADATPTKGWKYSTASGEFIINSGATTILEPDFTYDQW